jgi:hypothetical protein
VNSRTEEELIGAIPESEAILIITGYEETREHSIMKGWKKKYGKTYQSLLL